MTRFERFLKVPSPIFPKTSLPQKKNVLPPLHVNKTQPYIDHRQASVEPLIELFRFEVRFLGNALEINAILMIPDLS